MNKALKGVASFAVLLAIWQALAVSGWFPSSLFPGPVSVAQALVDRASSGQLVLDIGASMYRFFIGYLIACASATFPPSWLSFWRRSSQCCSPRWVRCAASIQCV